MRKQTAKRGFTITELVIVIVVIAILAAVLIPTFVSLIKKANLSADQQSVRQMNVILAAEESHKKIDDVGDAAEVLLANGIDPHHNPLTVDTAFYWVKAINRIVHADAEKNILYPTKLGDEAAYAEGNWFSIFTGDFVGGEGTEEAPYLVATEDQLYQLEDYTDETVYVELLDDIVFTGSGDATYISTCFQGVFDGNGHTIYNTTTDTSGPCLFYGTWYDDTTVKNLTIVNEGVVKPLFYRNDTGADYNGGVLTIENVVVKGSDPNKIYETCGYGSGPFVAVNNGSVYFKNCVNELNYTITGHGYGGIFIGNYSNNYTFASFENCVNKGTVNGTYVGFFTGNETRDVTLVDSNATPNFYHSTGMNVYVSNCANEGVMMGSNAVDGFGCNWPDRETSNDTANAALTEAQFKRGTMTVGDIEIGLSGMDSAQISVVGSNANIAKFEVQIRSSVGYADDSNGTIIHSEYLTPAEITAGKTVANVSAFITKEEHLANGGTYDASQELTYYTYRYVVINNGDGTRTIVVNLDEAPTFRRFGDIEYSVVAYNAEGHRIATKAYYG